MSQLFYIDEEERCIGKSYALAKFCIGLSLLDNKKFIIVTAASFRQSKIVLKHIHYILDDNQIFNETNTQVDNMSVSFGRRIEIVALPISRALTYVDTDIILDEHKMIPHELMAILQLSRDPMQDIRQYNLFELLESIPIG